MRNRPQAVYVQYRLPAEQSFLSMHLYETSEIYVSVSVYISQYISQYYNGNFEDFM